MKRFYISMILLAAVQGCMTSDGLGTLNMSEINVSNLSRVRVGMTEHEVYHIMDQPYQTRELTRNGDRYHVWFYVTNPTIMAQTETVHQNLTPLTFKLSQINENPVDDNSQNDPEQNHEYVLVNIGWDYYRALENNEPLGPTPVVQPIIAPPAPPAPPNAQQQQQAKEIEDALKANPPTTPQAQPEPEKTEEELNLEKVLNTDKPPNSPAPMNTPTDEVPADVDAAPKTEDLPDNSNS